jgi:two-component system, chemotaxis family, protein-glutamate methylesterase/glutaminase
MADERKRIRVLVVDDSAVMRKLIPNLLDRDKEIEVVGTAIDGDFAINKIEQLKPDVVTLDIEMPRMDGLSTLGQIVSKYSLPVVMLSSFTTRGASLTLRALEMGAVDFICKPDGVARIGEMAGELISKVKSAAQSRVFEAGVTPARPIAPKPLKRVERLGVASRATERLIAIGASSGGPHALRQLLPSIPADFPAGIVIVQHMPESFTAMLAKWLDELCELDVREAKTGDFAAPGRVLIAPGNLHLRVRRSALGAEVYLDRGQPVNGHMPSVDVLFKSVAEQFGAHSVGLILTGMGSDGARGIGDIKKAGGFTIAQDRESCVVFGMPKTAIELGHIDRVVALDAMASALFSAVGQTGGMEVIDYVGVK